MLQCEHIQSSRGEVVTQRRTHPAAPNHSGVEAPHNLHRDDAGYEVDEFTKRRKRLSVTDIVPVSVTSESPPLRKEFLEPKMKFIRETMEQKGIDLWLTFTREGNQDPIANDLLFGGLTWRSAALIDSDGNRTALVGSLEKEAVEQRGFYHHVHGYGSEGAAPKLRELIAERKPKKIGVNTSYDFGTADGLSEGMNRYLRASLKEHVRSFVSAEDLAIALRGRLIPKEVDLVKKSIELCERIYKYAEDEVIRPGRTDAQIHNLMRGRVKEMGLETAWGEDHCPSVLIGKLAGGHVGYHNSKLKEGQFLKLDFGVRYEGYCSDIQHCYFVGSQAMPSEVKCMFDTARMANDASLRKLKPGVKGYVVDAASRRVIARRGFPDFAHATGHPVGRDTHEIGPLLGPRWPWRYGKSAEKPVQKDMVYTVEPTVVGALGTCNLEQDVLTTATGYAELSKPQEEVIRIG